jgi:hypothetical protein
MVRIEEEGIIGGYAIINWGWVGHSTSSRIPKVYGRGCGQKIIRRMRYGA